jgi:hypothetical protein
MRLSSSPSLCALVFLLGLPACGGEQAALPAGSSSTPDAPEGGSVIVDTPEGGDYTGGLADSSSVPRQSVRAFFSGHSLLDNPLPDWIESIATSKGDTLEWDEQIVIGSPIRIRTKGEDPESADFTGYQLGKDKNGGSIDVLSELAQPTELGAGGKYERLVITERNDLLGTIRYENTVGNLRDYEDRLFSQNPAAGTSLYACWPDIGEQDPNMWIAYTRNELFVWECVATKINQSLQQEGRSDRVEVLPGGVALARLVELALAGEVPGISGTPEERLGAIFADEVHLQPLGVYLLASTHYASLFGKSPVGAASPAGVNAEAVPTLQSIAWDTMTEYRARAARAPSLADCRTRIANELCPAYYRFRGNPDAVDQCDVWAEADSPL